ncbi:MAG TPA: amino acid adenylation domain-containing protein [Herpetosiphonaceae bacterium]
MQPSEGFRLSPQQKRLWQLQTGQSTAYRTQGVVLIEGPLQAESLLAALQQIVDRNEILRTSFHRRAGMALAVQVIADETTPTLEQHDLGAASPEQQATRIEMLLDQLAEQHRDLGSGSLLRTALVRLGESRHALLLSLPALCADAATIGNLARELAQAYAAEPFADDPTQYADVAELFNELLDSDDTESGRDYWRQQEPGPSVQPALPLETPAADRTFAPQRRTLMLDRTIAAEIEECARQHNTSAEIVLLACWQILLGRLSAADAIVVGTLYAGRTYEGLDSAPGLFARYVPVRCQLDAQTTFSAIVQQIARSAQTIEQLQEYFSWDLYSGQAAGEQPGFAFGFDYTRYPAAFSAADLRWTIRQQSDWIDRFKLRLACAAREEALAIDLHFDPNSYAAADAQRLIERFGTLLLAAIADAQTPIAELAIIGPQERHWLIAGLNATQHERQVDRSLHQLFAEQTARTPDACAVIYETGTRERVALSYTELDERANRLANFLLERGVAQRASAETAVALCVERSVEMIVGVLGIWKAGAAYLPLDPSYPAERLQFVLGDAQAPILLTQQHLRDRFSAESLRSTHVICLDSDWPAIAGASAEQPAPQVSADNAAYVIYTSGSTGTPKGVVVQHRSVVNLLAGLDRAIYGEAATPLRVSMNGPLVFDTSVKQMVQLLRGHTLVIVPEELRLDPPALSAFLQEQQVDVFDCTPSLLKPLLEADQLGAYPARFLIGGEAIGEALWQTLAQIEDHQFYNLYGPTECTVDATISRIDGSTPTIGRPIANVEVYLLDREQQLVPFGLPGEICIGGAGVARGYLNRPDLIAEKFIPDPFGETSGARLYRTGDLGRYRADGAIEYGGRIDDQVKLRGFRVELGEIESVLTQHPAVQDAAVILRSEESQRLIAYVVPDAQSAFTVRQLLRLEREGRIARDAIYELPNAMVVAQVNKNETEFLYNEIFAEQAYLRHGITLAADACVFDIGANVGMFALFVGRHSPSATIYAFEPIPPVFEVLRTNAQLYNFKIVPLPYGLAESVKEATFTYYAHASTMSGRYVDADEERAVIRSLLLTQEQERSDGARLDAALLDEMIAERLTSERFTCHLTTISEMMRQHALTAIDLLKIDAQKSELDVLLGIAAEDWPKIRQIVLEVHDIAGRVAQVQALLEREGYSVVVEQETAMAGTPLYAVYARRADREPASSVVAVEPQPTWAKPDRLTGDLRRWLSERLPEYMVPAAFVLLESLPLTTNGKLDRRALPDPEQSRSTAKHNFVAPRTRVETLLAQIWAELLHVERVGIDDNFFELGGDSILCIQVVARANKAGLSLAPRQIFAHQTIAELAKVVGDAAGVGETLGAEQNDREPLSSALPLLPAQQWFFDQEWPDLRAWNQMIGLELRQPIAPEQLEPVLVALIRHHDALRLRFTRTDGGWRQEIAPPTEQIPFTTIDLADVPDAEQAQAIERIAADLNADLDLGAGMLLHGALIERGSARPDLLLLVTHALAMDGFSRRILAEDLQTACQQVLAGEPIRLPAKTTSLKRWAETLVGYAASDELQRELDYWLATASAAAPRLPRDAQDSSAIDTPQTVVITLDGEETRALLQDVPAAYRTEINDVLLAALALACEQWSGRPTLALDLRGHGREPIGEGIDLSRTVGWLTGIFPVALDLGGATEPAAALVAVKEQLRRIPNHGIGYGVLRYLSHDPIARRLRELPRPEISFNYLGQFDQVLPEQTFGLAAEMVDPSSGLWSPGYLLEIQGGVVGGQLRLAWKYDPSQHQRATIERLAQDFRAALRDLIAHCQSPDAGGYTPSDFPLANLNQQALDTILAQVRKTQG